MTAAKSTKKFVPVGGKRMAYVESGAAGGRGARRPAYRFLGPLKAVMTPCRVRNSCSVHPAR